jgi:hypothetical protein
MIMTRHYFEQRSRVSDRPEEVMADVMRHFHARQHLGRAIVVCADPAARMAAAHKQWLRLSRDLQRRRGRSADAVEILKYTYTIAQMQHVIMSEEQPSECPEARIHFVRAGSLEAAGAPIATTYILAGVTPGQLGAIASALMPSGTIVDYSGSADIPQARLLPRADLETAVSESWRELERYVAGKGVRLGQLSAHRTTESMDDAVDVLLGVESAFLARAGEFQHTLDLARPLHDTSKVQRMQYETLIQLAHRVQTFASAGFSAQFLHTYSDDDFLLRDGLTAAQALAVADIQRHRLAGRWRLAAALTNRLQRRASARRPYGAMAAA